MVTVYSKPGCGKCIFLKKWLTLKEVEYQEIDITKDDEAKQKIVESGRKSLPVVEINNEFVDFEVHEDILDYLKDGE